MLNSVISKDKIVVDVHEISSLCKSTGSFSYTFCLKSRQDSVLLEYNIDVVDHNISSLRKVTGSFSYTFCLKDAGNIFMISMVAEDTLQSSMLSPVMSNSSWKFVSDLRSCSMIMCTCCMVVGPLKALLRRSNSSSRRGEETLPLRTPS